MAESREFLLEIGTEELPAAAARAAASQAGPLALDIFTRHNLAVEPGDVRVWVTPRRIAINIGGLAAMQPDQEIAERGPILSKAFDDEGKPTKAAAGFARAKGIAVESLEQREHQGQQFVFAVHTREGRPTVELLPEICTQILRGINFPKTMRWNSAGLRFSRPVRWLVTKYGPDTVEYEAEGVPSAGSSRGHRFLGEARIEITDAGAYARLLADNRVTVDQEERRRIILAGLAAEAARMGARYIDPAGELEEVIYLVENPSVHPGSFGEEHLRLPDRVLITAMQSHQRYFPVTDEEGALKAGFLYVMNGDPAAAAGITEGNERVLEGRIEDAEFSFDQDLKTGIEAMAGNLGSVVFHRKLGSLADKTARLQKLVQAIGGLLSLCGPDQETALSAARLAKADQVSNMVQEFSDLEGHIGSVYAAMEGYSADICTAIEEHFLPVSSGGDLPGTVAGAVLAIADKIDNIMGSFAINELPTGSRDPYGLRRAAAGLAEISGRFGFDFDLTELLKASHELYINQKGADVSRDPAVTQAAFEFVCDRIQHRLVERGMPSEVAEAARRAGLRSTLRLGILAEALDRFRSQPGFDDLHTAYFRSSKIAAKAGEEAGAAVDPALFDSDSERDLHESLEELEPRVAALTGARNYAEALTAAAGIRPAIDRFFEEVMIMAEDEAVRRNRLALVSRAAGILHGLGDPMLVAAAPQ